MTYVNNLKEDLIHKLYQACKIDWPCNDYHYFAERLGISCHDGTTNQALFYKGVNYIFIDRTLPSSKRWEAFGHELGHVMLHWGSQLSISKEVRYQQEIEADQFALYFCVPSFLLKQIELENDIRYATGQVAEAFGVTHAFAYNRLLLFERRNEYVLSKTQ